MALKKVRFKLLLRDACGHTKCSENVWQRSFLAGCGVSAPLSRLRGKGNGKLDKGWDYCGLESCQDVSRASSTVSGGRSIVFPTESRTDCTQRKHFPALKVCSLYNLLDTGLCQKQKFVGNRVCHFRKNTTQTQRGCCFRHFFGHFFPHLFQQYIEKN